MTHPARLKLTAAASASGVEYKTIYRWVRAGLIPGAEYNKTFSRWTVPADWKRPTISMGRPRKPAQKR